VTRRPDPPAVALFTGAAPTGLLLDAAADALHGLGLPVTARLVRDTVPGEYRAAAIANALADLRLVRGVLVAAGAEPWVRAVDQTAELLACAADRCKPDYRADVAH